MPENVMNGRIKDKSYFGNTEGEIFMSRSLIILSAHLFMHTAEEMAESANTFLIMC